MSKEASNISRKIQLLPDFIANQIAAGEVVQRPESVVKELVENALDSGADTIAVIVRDAGKKLIHVVDNGSGMSRDDLGLATKRHATSKIASQEDLEEILSYGFRGEALASISSVAHLEIRTKRRDDDLGYKLVSNPNNEEIITPENIEKGTQVFVKNLFYNVPARRKFLKSNLTEFRHISDTMLKFAVSRPDIRFTFYDNETLIFDLQPSSLKDRIKNALGENTSDSLVELHYESGYIKLSGFIGLPDIARQSRYGQYLFLNGRSIRSRSLGHAVFSAYEHLLEKSQHPVYILNLEIDPKRVDINVHPQKHEVKFEDERYIYNTILNAVGKTLSGHNLIPEINLTEQISHDPFEVIPDADNPSEVQIVNKVTGEIVETGLSRSKGGSWSGHSKYRHNQEFESHRISKRELSAFDALFGKPVDKTASPGQSEINPANVIPEQINNCWQFLYRYIFIQTEQRLLIIDQKQAHERILYEKALKALKKEITNFQELLFPTVIKLSPGQAGLVNDIQQELADLGFKFTINSDFSLDLSSVPIDIKPGHEEDSFTAILDSYNQNKGIDKSTVHEGLARSYSLRASFNYGDKLSRDEMKSISSMLFKCGVPGAGPTGRKTYVVLNVSEIEELFS